MTLTATRPPEAPAADTEVPVVIPENWLTTSDHKRLGRMYVVASVLFLLVGGGVAVVMEIERAGQGSSAIANNYGRLFSLHSTVTPLLFLAPLWIGLATYLVPLQIGARRLAYPRVAATAFWTYVSGGLLLLASYTFGKPNGAGIALSQPLAPIKGGATRATDLWAASLIVITIAALLAAANLFTTIVKLRAEGMTMIRVPAFTFSVLASSIVILLSGPIFVAGMLLVYLDQHFGGQVFLASQTNANIVWQHTVWLYGRPDLYVLFLPALGAVSDIVETHARRPLFMAPVVKGAIIAFAVLSFGVLAAPARTGTAVVLPTPTVLTGLLALPVLVCLLMWLATVRPAALRLHVSLLYVGGFVLLVLMAWINAMIAAFAHIKADSAWSTGQLHALLFGAPTLAAFAAVYHWAPKIWGRPLKAALGVVQWLLVFAGFALSALGSWLLGYAGAPWHVGKLTGAGTKSSWLALSRLSGIGGGLVALGILVFVVNLAVTWAGTEQSADDPYEAFTLEWATSSPPPADNFAYVPEVQSDTPLADMRAAAVAGDGGAA